MKAEEIKSGKTYIGGKLMNPRHVIEFRNDFERLLWIGRSSSVVPTSIKAFARWAKEEVPS